MPKKRTFIALTLALLLAAALCLLLWLSPEEQTDDDPTEGAQLLFDRNNPDAVKALSFACGDNQTLELTRVGDEWQLSGHPNLPITRASVNALLGTLEHMLALRTISESCEDLAEYRLDTPYAWVRVSTDSSEKRYLFGSYSAHYDGYYCMIEGEKAVYMVEARYADQFDLTLEDLLGSDRLPDLGNLQSIEWRYPDGRTRSAEPDSESAALLSSLELGRWIDYGVDRFAVYGLDAPAVVNLTLWDGAPLTLSFARGETDEYIYLRVGESEMIYLAECDDLDLLGKYVEGSAQRWK